MFQGVRHVVKIRGGTLSCFILSVLRRKVRSIVEHHVKLARLGAHSLLHNLRDSDTRC